ncbi:tetratricopeptide repeat protein [Streptomyces sp. NBC_01381]|uniref:tetratricopeptide repeat protein n=1 Tax=Streptomyces sp. NBC_01381 TaxID=2903845 RepID=UPI0022575DBA|nr:tetratricopeptide repeat protein [Streptomyces sp. NBC_01381]MCX4666258.1 tetratricopeptide repeat protein [Streptomyces sp. NBC_01381]
MGENTVSGGRQDAVVQADTVHNVTITSPPQSEESLPRYLRDSDRWPLTDEWEALAAGAHRARPGDDGSKLPPYVERDVDEVLREAVARGGLVVVVGDSTAGKTRASYEAVRAVLPGRRVVAPPPGGHLERAPEVVERAGVPCVVWLDDLERYLGPEGLEPDVLEDLVRLDVPVVATMRLKPYETFSLGQEDGIGSRVLRLAEVVDLNRLWSDEELSRAGDCDDSRIVDAVAHHGTYGIGEYLAAGPALLREWRHAWSAQGHPRGAALVSAAVDLTRTGLRGPYPQALLAELHDHYLAAAGGRVLRPEPLEEAFHWASRVRFGVTSLLVPMAEERWAAFDYLVDAAESAVPGWTWDGALGSAADEDDGFAIGVSAYRANEHSIAEAAWRPLVEASDMAAANNLANLLTEDGRTEEAEQLYRHAHNNGDPDATYNLAILLAETGRTDEAEHLYRHAHNNGHPNAAYNLAILLAETGRTDEAEHLYRHAHNNGHPNAANNLAILLAETGRTDEAEHLYRHAHNNGHPNAANNLAILLNKAGHTDEAEQLYRHAHNNGDPDATYNLAILLAETGRTDEAEQLYRHAHNNGDPNAAHNLAILLEESGRTDEAEALRRQIAEAEA